MNLKNAGVKLKFACFQIAGRWLLIAERASKKDTVVDNAEKRKGEHRTQVNEMCVATGDLERELMMRC